MQRIASGVLTSTVIFYLLIHWGFGVISYPRSVFIIDGVFLMGFLVGIRLPFRLYREGWLWRGKKKVLIYGAGDAGEQIVREMKNHPSYYYAPIGFVADDLPLVGQRIHGVKVLGTRHDLSNIIAKQKPQEVVVALPEINPALLRHIIKELEAFKVPIKTLPGIRDVLDGKFTISQIRHLEIEDLLPRSPVASQPQSVRQMVEGKAGHGHRSGGIHWFRVVSADFEL